MFDKMQHQVRGLAGFVQPREPLDGKPRRGSSRLRRRGLQVTRGEQGRWGWRSGGNGWRRDVPCSTDAIKRAYTEGLVAYLRLEPGAITAPRRAILASWPWCSVGGGVFPTAEQPHLTQPQTAPPAGLGRRWPVPG